MSDNSGCPAHPYAVGSPHAAAAAAHPRVHHSIPLSADVQDIAGSPAVVAGEGRMAVAVAVGDILVAGYTVAAAAAVGIVGPGCR